MRMFLEKTHDDEAREAFDCKSWDDVQSEAAKAVQAFDAHNKRRRNWRHPFEVVHRVGGICIRRIGPFIELVPDGDYTHILVGALKLLYNVRMCPQRQWEFADN